MARYTDAKLKNTNDVFPPFPLPSFPSPVQSEQVVHNFYTRGEAVVDPLNGRFVSYFGVNWINTWNLAANPLNDPTTTIAKGYRIRFDYRVDLNLAPNALLIFCASDQTETFRQDALNKSSNLRGQFVELQTDYQKTFFLVANGRIDDDEFFGSHATYRVAPAVIVPWTDTKFRASYGTGFKVPTLSQRFQDFPQFNFFGNPNLKPESSTGYDIGFEQPLWDKRALVGATYFNNDLTDLIQANQTFTTNINIGHARTNGVEAFAAVNVTERVKLRADYTFTRAIDTDTGLELIRRPRHKWSLQALWNPIDPLTPSATLVHVGDWIDGNRDFSVPRLIAPGYTVVNVAANYQFNPNLKTFAGSTTCSTALSESTGFLRPGIGAYAGVTYPEGCRVCPTS